MLDCMSAPIVRCGKDNAVTVATLVATNTDEDMVAPTWGSSGVCVWRGSLESVSFVLVRLAEIWLQSP
jgi:hypothetical protein